jgi:hypothetical protein
MSPFDSDEKDRTDPTRWQRRAALVEINRRRVNEAIERGDSGPAPVFLCECGRPGCGETVRVPVGNYEAVRSNWDRFLLVKGHEIEEIERVIERAPGYLVVAKREPEAKELARQTDERGE